LWKQYTSALSVSSIFLYGHSIGGAVVVVSASLHGSSPQDAHYPLCGISISGFGSNVKKLPMPQFDMDPQDMKSQSLRFPNEQKDALMLGPPKGYDIAILQQTERLQHDISVPELYDINVVWPSYWRKYTAEVHVPVTYTLGEHDGLWGTTDQDVKEFASSFVRAPTVEARRLLSAPHCIELSLQAPGLIICTFGFAIESATCLKLGS
jgi:pimeloyl-ACP methyl ester carboxylesterase